MITFLYRMAFLFNAFYLTGDGPIRAEQWH